jgi:hypothetical protein
MGKIDTARRNTVLCLLLAVQIGIIVFMFWPVAKPVIGIGPVLKDFKGDLVTAVTITDEQGAAISLLQVAGNWVIGPVINGQAALPANAEKLTALLTKLAAIQRDRLVTRTAASHNRLKVGQLFDRRLTLTTPAGDTTILLGSAPNYKNIHVRLEPENEVYLVRDLSAWEAPVERSAWWLTDYVKVDPASLTSLALHNQKGGINLSKDEKGAWQLAGQPPGRELAAEALRTLLADLCTLTILEYHENVTSPSWDKPSATLTLTTATDTLTLEVGPKDVAKDEYPVKSSASPFSATASPFAIKDLLNHQASDLLAAQKTVAPGQ